MNMKIALIFIVVYFICMFNPAIIICKRKTKTDIRRIGTLDASSTNALKVLGKPLGFITIILNVFKVIAGFYIARAVARVLDIDVTTGAFQSAVVLGTMIGHCFPVIHKFNGGKGIIEFVTLMSILNYKYVLICLVVAILVIIFTKVIVKGTLAGCVLYLFLAIILGCNYIPALVISLGIILFKHKENLLRIKYNQEEKI